MSDQKIKNNCILVIDDSYEFHQMIKAGFGNNYKIESARDMDFAWNYLKTKQIDLILLDLALKGENYKEGLPRITKIKEEYPNIPLIVVTSDDTRDTVVEATQHGADYFLYKGDYDTSDWNIRFKLSLQLKSLAEKNTVLQKENQDLIKKVNKLENHQPLIGESSQMKNIKKQLEFLGQKSITVLIEGETGVGKEVAARYLHQKGVRNNKLFQAIHLSSIQESLLESRLFGHKKGSFTGAVNDQIGLFQQANGGILFLDEIGEISLEIQIKLLRFLEDQIIRIIGSNKDIKLDVQIIAATNKNLKDEVRNGKFREDLYQRLKVFPITIPPLRERKEDIPLLLSHFLNIEKEELSLALTHDTIEKIQNHFWSGNIRELRNTIEYAKLQKGFKGISQIDSSCLPSDILNQKPTFLLNKENMEKTDNLSHEEKMALTELKRIENSLKRHFNKKGAVALELKTNTDALRYLIKKYFEKYPTLFLQLPHISKTYKKKL